MGSLHIRKTRFSVTYRLTACFVAMTFSMTIVMPPRISYAQMLPNLPVPGVMVSVSPALVPPMLKGITIHPEHPLKFEFIVDRGNTDIKIEELKEESTRLIKYFLASLTIPEEELWVNLSPYEEDRIITESFGLTEMGRDLLAQDYVLKQLMASLSFPDSGLGKQFWDRVFKKAYEMYGDTTIPINTFNKVWILPEAAEVYEEGNTAYIVKSRLKVMLEEDYLAMKENLRSKERGTVKIKREQVIGISNVSSEIVREVLIPEIEKEVNEGKNFILLRQVYQSMILATWYKQRFMVGTGRDLSLLGQIYVDKGKIKGVEVKDKDIKNKIYEQYIEAFRDGVYDIIREDYDEHMERLVPRRYFSGGFGFKKIRETMTMRKEITEVERQEAVGVVNNSVSIDVALLADKETEEVLAEEEGKEGESPKFLKAEEIPQGSQEEKKKQKMDYVLEEMAGAFDGKIKEVNAVVEEFCQAVEELDEKRLEDSYQKWEEIDREIEKNYPEARIAGRSWANYGRLWDAMINMHEFSREYIKHKAKENQESEDMQNLDLASSLLIKKIREVYKNEIPTWILRSEGITPEHIEMNLDEIYADLMYRNKRAEIEDIFKRRAERSKKGKKEKGQEGRSVVKELKSRELEEFDLLLERMLTELVEAEVITEEYAEAYGGLSLTELESVDAEYIKGHPLFTGEGWEDTVEELKEKGGMTKEGMTKEEVRKEVVETILGDMFGWVKRHKKISVAMAALPFLVGGAVEIVNHYGVDSVEGGYGSVDGSITEGANERVWGQIDLLDKDLLGDVTEIDVGGIQESEQLLPEEGIGNESLAELKELESQRKGLEQQLLKEQNEILEGVKRIEEMDQRIKEIAREAAFEVKTKDLKKGNMRKGKDSLPPEIRELKDKLMEKLLGDPQLQGELMFPMEGFLKHGIFNKYDRTTGEWEAKKINLSQMEQVTEEPFVMENSVIWKLDSEVTALSLPKGYMPNPNNMKFSTDQQDYRLWYDAGNGACYLELIGYKGGEVEVTFEIGQKDMTRRGPTKKDREELTEPLAEKEELHAETRKVLEETKDPGKVKQTTKGKMEYMSDYISRTSDYSLDPRILLLDSMAGGKMISTLEDESRWIEIEYETGQVKKYRPGVCRHFSSLLIAMARLEGILARPALGYRNDFGDEIVSHELDMQVEYWNEEAGQWEIIDPTGKVKDHDRDSENKLKSNTGEDVLDRRTSDMDSDMVDKLVDSMSEGFKKEAEKEKQRKKMKEKWLKDAHKKLEERMNKLADINQTAEQLDRKTGYQRNRYNTEKILRDYGKEPVLARNAEGIRRRLSSLKRNNPEQLTEEVNKVKTRLDAVWDAKKTTEEADVYREYYLTVMEDLIDLLRGEERQKIVDAYYEYLNGEMDNLRTTEKKVTVALDWQGPQGLSDDMIRQLATKEGFLEIDLSRHLPVPRARAKQGEDILTGENVLKIRVLHEGKLLRPERISQVQEGKYVVTSRDEDWKNVIQLMDRGKEVFVNVVEGSVSLNNFKISEDGSTFVYGTTEGEIYRGSEKGNELIAKHANVSQVHISADASDVVYVASEDILGRSPGIFKNGKRLISMPEEVPEGVSTHFGNRGRIMIYEVDKDCQNIVYEIVWGGKVRKSAEEFRKDFMEGWRGGAIVSREKEGYIKIVYKNNTELFLGQGDLEVNVTEDYADVFIKGRDPNGKMVVYKNKKKMHEGRNIDTNLADDSVVVYSVYETIPAVFEEGNLLKEVTPAIHEKYVFRVDLKTGDMKPIGHFLTGSGRDAPTPAVVDKETGTVYHVEGNQVYKGDQVIPSDVGIQGKVEDIHCLNGRDAVLYRATPTVAPKELSYPRERLFNNGTMVELVSPKEGIVDISFTEEGAICIVRDDTREGYLEDYLVFYTVNAEGKEDTREIRLGDRFRSGRATTSDNGKYVAYAEHKKDGRVVVADISEVEGESVDFRTVSREYPNAHWIMGLQVLDDGNVIYAAYEGHGQAGLYVNNERLPGEIELRKREHTSAEAKSDALKNRESNPEKYFKANFGGLQGEGENLYLETSDFTFPYIMGQGVAFGHKTNEVDSIGRNIKGRTFLEGESTYSKKRDKFETPIISITASDPIEKTINRLIADAGRVDVLGSSGYEKTTNDMLEMCGKDKKYQEKGLELAKRLVLNPNASGELLKKAMDYPGLKKWIVEHGKGEVKEALISQMRGIAQEFKEGYGMKPILPGMSGKSWFTRLVLEKDLLRRFTSRYVLNEQRVKDAVKEMERINEGLGRIGELMPGLQISGEEVPEIVWTKTEMAEETLGVLIRTPMDWVALMGIISLFILGASKEAKHRKIRDKTDEIAAEVLNELAKEGQEGTEMFWEVAGDRLIDELSKEIEGEGNKSWNEFIDKYYKGVTANERKMFTFLLLSYGKESLLGFENILEKMIANTHYGMMRGLKRAKSWKQERQEEAEDIQAQWSKALDLIKGSDYLKEDQLPLATFLDAADTILLGSGQESREKKEEVLPEWTKKWVRGNPAVGTLARTFDQIKKSKGVSSSGDFRDYRPYISGVDDASAIDANIEMRTGEKMVKVREEDEPLDVTIAIDVSNSMGINRETLDKASELGYALGQVARQNGNRVRYVLFSDGVVSYIPASQSSTIEAVKEIQEMEEGSRGKTSIDNMLKYVGGMSQKKGAVVIISDWADSGFEKNLKGLANMPGRMVMGVNVASEGKVMGEIMAEVEQKQGKEIKDILGGRYVTVRTKDNVAESIRELLDPNSAKKGKRKEGQGLVRSQEKGVEGQSDSAMMSEGKQEEFSKILKAEEIPEGSEEEKREKKMEFVLKEIIGLLNETMGEVIAAADNFLEVAQAGELDGEKVEERYAGWEAAAESMEERIGKHSVTSLQDPWYPIYFRLRFVIQMKYELCRKKLNSEGTTSTEMARVSGGLRAIDFIKDGLQEEVIEREGLSQESIRLNLNAIYIELLYRKIRAGIEARYKGRWGKEISKFNAKELGEFQEILEEVIKELLEAGVISEEYANALRELNLEELGELDLDYIKEHLLFNPEEVTEELTEIAMEVEEDRLEEDARQEEGDKEVSEGGRRKRDRVGSEETRRKTVIGGITEWVKGHKKLTVALGSLPFLIAGAVAIINQTGGDLVESSRGEISSGETGDEGQEMLIGAVEQMDLKQAFDDIEKMVDAPGEQEFKGEDVKPDEIKEIATLEEKIEQLEKEKESILEKIQREINEEEIKAEAVKKLLEQKFQDENKDMQIGKLNKTPPNKFSKKLGGIPQMPNSSIPPVKLEWELKYPVEGFFRDEIWNEFNRSTDKWVPRDVDLSTMQVVTESPAEIDNEMKGKVSEPVSELPVLEGHVLDPKDIQFSTGEQRYRVFYDDISGVYYLELLDYTDGEIEVSYKIGKGSRPIRGPTKEEKEDLTKRIEDDGDFNDDTQRVLDEQIPKLPTVKEKMEHMLNYIGQTSDYSLNPELLKIFASVPGKYIANIDGHRRDIKDEDGITKPFREGSCSHFATLLVAMARHAGIQARPVGGYLNKNKGIQLLNHESHMIVEYYDKDLGKWKTIDPTAVVKDRDRGKGGEGLADELEEGGIDTISEEGKMIAEAIIKGMLAEFHMQEEARINKQIRILREELQKLDKKTDYIQNEFNERYIRKKYEKEMVLAEQAANIKKRLETLKATDPDQFETEIEQVKTHIDLLWDAAKSTQEAEVYREYYLTVLEEIIDLLDGQDRERMIDSYYEFLNQQMPDIRQSDKKATVVLDWARLSDDQIRKMATEEGFVEIDLSRHLPLAHYKADKDVEVLRDKKILKLRVIDKQGKTLRPWDIMEAGEDAYLVDSVNEDGNHVIQYVHKGEEVFANQVEGNVESEDGSIIRFGDYKISEDASTVVFATRTGELYRGSRDTMELIAKHDAINQVHISEDASDVVYVGLKYTGDEYQPEIYKNGSLLLDSPLNASSVYIRAVDRDCSKIVYSASYDERDVRELYVNGTKLFQGKAVYDVNVSSNFSDVFYVGEDVERKEALYKNKQKILGGDLNDSLSLESVNDSFVIYKLRKRQWLPKYGFYFEEELVKVDLIIGSVHTMDTMFENQMGDDSRLTLIGHSADGRYLVAKHDYGFGRGDAVYKYAVDGLEPQILSSSDHEIGEVIVDNKTGVVYHTAREGNELKVYKEDQIVSSPLIGIASPIIDEKIGDYTKLVTASEKKYNRIRSLHHIEGQDDDVLYVADAENIKWPLINGKARLFRNDSLIELVAPYELVRNVVYREDGRTAVCSVMVSNLGEHTPDEVFTDMNIFYSKDQFLDLVFYNVASDGTENIQKVRLFDDVAQNAYYLSVSNNAKHVACLRYKDDGWYVMTGDLSKRDKESKEALEFKTVSKGYATAAGHAQIMGLQVLDDGNVIYLVYEGEDKAGLYFNNDRLPGDVKLLRRRGERIESNCEIIDNMLINRSEATTSDHLLDKVERDSPSEVERDSPEYFNIPQVGIQNEDGTIYLYTDRFKFPYVPGKGIGIGVNTENVRDNEMQDRIFIYGKQDKKVKDNRNVSIMQQSDPVEKTIHRLIVDAEKMDILSSSGYEKAAGDMLEICGKDKKYQEKGLELAKNIVINPYASEELFKKASEYEGIKEWLKESDIKEIKAKIVSQLGNISEEFKEVYGMKPILPGISGKGWISKTLLEKDLLPRLTSRWVLNTEKTKEAVEEMSRINKGLERIFSMTEGLQISGEEVPEVVWTAKEIAKETLKEMTRGYVDWGILMGLIGLWILSYGSKVEGDRIIKRIQEKEAEIFRELARKGDAALEIDGDRYWEEVGDRMIEEMKGELKKESRSKLEEVIKGYDFVEEYEGATENEKKLFTYLVLSHGKDLLNEEGIFWAIVSSLPIGVLSNLKRIKGEKEREGLWEAVGERIEESGIREEKLPWVTFFEAMEMLMEGVEEVEEGKDEGKEEEKKEAPESVKKWKGKQRVIVRISDAFGREFDKKRRGGMEFEDFRPYVEGEDSADKIDGKVLARTGKKMIRVNQEEEPREMIIAVDVSGSMGSSKEGIKKAAEAAYALGEAARRNYSEVGYVLFRDGLVKYHKPSRRENVEVVEDILEMGGEVTGETSIGGVTDYLGGLKKKGAVYALITDFVDEGYEKRLRHFGNRHEVMGINVRGEGKVPGREGVQEAEIREDQEEELRKIFRGKYARLGKEAEVGQALMDAIVGRRSKGRERKKDQRIEEREERQEDAAMMSDVGGIDFNPAHLKLQIKRDGKGVPLPVYQQDIENIQIEGLRPIIINITPATYQHLPFLSQEAEKPEGQLSYLQ